MPLPETADELCAVAEDVRADARDIHLGTHRTEREIKRLSANGELAKFRMAHFATHGVLAGRLDGTHEPGLILTPPANATEEDDGYLSASWWRWQTPTRGPVRPGSKSSPRRKRNSRAEEFGLDHSWLEGFRVPASIHGGPVGVLVPPLAFESCSLQYLRIARTHALYALGLAYFRASLSAGF